MKHVVVDSTLFFLAADFTGAGGIQPKVEGGAICRMGAKNVVKSKRAENFGPLIRKKFSGFSIE